jgi:adenylate cyclase
MDTSEKYGELVPQGGGDTIPLVRETLVLGRRESCDVCLRFPNVSGRHCELSFKDGFWTVRDLDSTNGIKVNGTKVGKKLLHPGDTITIAKRTFTIQYRAPTDRIAPLSEDDEEALLDQTLLEKAGLEKPRRHDPLPPGKRRGQVHRYNLDDESEEEPLPPATLPQEKSNEEERQRWTLDDEGEEELRKKT